MLKILLKYYNIGNEENFIENGNEIGVYFDGSYNSEGIFYNNEIVVFILVIPKGFKDFEKIKKFFENCGWILAQEKVYYKNNNYISYTFHKNKQVKTIDELPEVLYHLTPLSKLKKITKNGLVPRTSNIMFGKQQINLPDGEYVSIEEAQRALKQYLEEKDQENVVYKAKNGKLPYTNPKEIETLFAEAISGKAKIQIAKGSEKIKNQDTASFLYKDQEKNEYIRKGLLFLGKGKLTLPSGEYVSVKEIEQALEQYLVFEKKEEESKADDRIVAFDNKENETHKVRDVQKNKFKLWPVISTAVSNIARSLRNIRRRNIAYEER